MTVEDYYRRYEKRLELSKADEEKAGELYADQQTSKQKAHRNSLTIQPRQLIDGFLAPMLAAAVRQEHDYYKHRVYQDVIQKYPKTKLDAKMEDRLSTQVFVFSKCIDFLERYISEHPEETQ